MPRCVAIIAVIFAFIATSATRADAQDPVTQYMIEYFGGKFLDSVFDSGEPDLRLLDRRLEELERNAGLRGEMRDEIRKLRGLVENGVTRDEFQRMATRVRDEMGSIKRRLDSLEERVERLEVENEDLKNRTKHRESAEYFRQRGDRSLHSGELERSLANYNIALKLDPALLAAYQGRCAVYERQEAWGVVKADATNAIDHKGGGVFHRIRAIATCKLWGIRPCSFWSVGSYILPDLTRDVNLMLTEDFEQALKAKFDDAELLCLKGLFYVYIGTRDVGASSWKVNEDKARMSWINAAGAQFNIAIWIDPKSSLAHCGRAIINACLKKEDDAVKEIDEAIRLDPKQKDFYTLRSILASRRTTDEDIADCNTALRLDPTDIVPLIRRANAYQAQYLKTRDLEILRKAIADWEKATIQDPTYSWPHWEIWKALEYFGESEYQASVVHRTRYYKLDVAAEKRKAQDLLNR